MSECQNASSMQRECPAKIGDRVFYKKKPDTILTVTDVGIATFPNGANVYWLTAQSDDGRHAVMSHINAFARAHVKMTSDETNRFAELLREYCNGTLAPEDRDEYFSLLEKLEPSSS